MDGYELSIKNFFTDKLKNIEGHCIVGKCDELIKKVISSNTQIVVMSNVTIEKNIKHHNDLSVEDYRVLDFMFENYDFLLKDSDKTVGIIYTKTTQYYYSLKSTKSGDSIFLTSFRKTNKHDIKRIRNKSEKGMLEIIVDKQD